MKIKNCEVPTPLLSAPMMNISGYAFRSLLGRFGGCGLYYSEMLSSRKVPQERAESAILSGLGKETQVMLQLVGNDAECLRASVKKLEVYAPFGFDLNLGCSRAKIMHLGWGAAMCRDAKGTAACVAAMRNATEKPITIKLRTVWTQKQQAKTFLRMLEAEGADAVIIHPRTPEKIFTRPAKWEWIAEAKSMLRIPVIGNGDIFTPADARRMLEQTQCDGIMIGRGAVARPTIFREIMALLKNETAPASPSKADILEAYIRCLGEDISTAKRTAELKTFCEYFANGLPVPHWFWGPLQGKQDAAEIVKLARSFLVRKKL
ncbi:tRNA-dihydrouridine synthase family protein [candidate division FCPU426 bacterium]|nr:tRNA-dihydrouridine synthase family protein [candidate division FCPU426 bacterium]